MDVASYKEEFKKMCLRSKVQEYKSIRMARYLRGLRWSVQEEISLWTPTIVHKCYKLALKVEEENKKEQDSTSKGRGKGKDYGGHRGGYKGRSTKK